MERSRAAVLAALLSSLAGCAEYLDRIPAAHPPEPTTSTVEPVLPRDAVLEFLRARRATYEGDLPRSMAHLRAAAAHDPRSAALRTRLAESYLQLGQLDDAIRLCRQALKLDPQYCAAHHLIGRIASYQGDVTLAETCLRRSIDCDPSIEEAWRDLSYLLRAQGRLEEELELLDGFQPHSTDDGWLLRHRGETLRALGRTEEALEALRTAVEVDPEDGDSLAVVLETYAEDGQAVAFLEDLVFRYPSILELREELARLYVVDGRYEDAIDQYLSEFEQDPDNRDLYALHAASWLERLARYDAAERLLLQAAEEFPDSSMVMLRLGWVRESAGNAEGALEAWATIPDDDVYGSLALRERARLLTDSDQPDRARALLAEAVDGARADGQVPDLDVVAELARLLGEADDLSGAREVLDAMRLEDPARYAREIAWLHWHSGEISRAEVILNDAILSSGVDPEPALLLADIYRSEGLHSMGVEVLETALARLQAPDAEHLLPVGRYPTPTLRATQIESYQIEVMVSLGFLRGHAGDREGALESMHRVLELDGDDIRALNFIGYTYAEEGRQLEEAEAKIRQALTQRPLDPAILDSLGWVLFRMGRTDEALKILERAGARMPESAVIWQHLGEVLLDLGRIKEARAHLQRCLDEVDDDDGEEAGAGVRARLLLDELDEGSDP